MSIWQPQKKRIMRFLDYFKSLQRNEHRFAWMLAIAADTLQIAAFPLFAEGAASPVDDFVDMAVGVIMIRLLGWHWSFLPSFAAKLIPGADLFPTWTSAVWFVTRNRVGDESAATSASNPGEIEILPPDPAPAARR